MGSNGDAVPQVPPEQAAPGLHCLPQAPQLVPSLMSKVSHELVVVQLANPGAHG